ncbi:GNAT family N-acetyltransferase [Bacillaceae bacterium Marseille-Q3522]|nr:GNAT family N-acetyltransferase [Bacillaceae bacterium Marseille-Q3522]
MEFTLVKPTKELEQQYEDYISEWEQTKEKIVPSATKRHGKSYNEMMRDWEDQETEKVYALGFVPASLYFLIDSQKKIYGAVHIRHELNEKLINTGGHIGYGIRPSERKKGFATKMLSFALPIAKELGITRVLITCDKDNIASAKTILHNGGLMENEVAENGEIVQRYWINL